MVLTSMANKVSSLGIALTRIACPICGEQRPGDILMNKRLSPSEARKVESYDGKVIRFEPCPTCQAHLNDGVHFLIEADPDKSGLAPGDERALPQNVHRTGRYWGITREAAVRIFGENVERVSFISPDVAERMGLNNLQDDAPVLTRRGTKDMSEMKPIQRHEESVFFDLTRGRRDFEIVDRVWEHNLLWIYWRWK